MSKLRNWIVFIAVAGVVFALDQISKTLVEQHLALGASWTPIPLLAPVFKITRSANSGAAFSIFQGANFVLLALSLVMAAAIILYHRQVPASYHLSRVALAVLLGGVLGNALDRIRLGTVTDFINWQIPNIISNVSNLADHAIVFSVILLLITQCRASKVSKEKETSSDPSPHP